MVETEVIASSLIAKIIMFAAGMAALLTMTKTGENMYKFEVGDNLFLILGGLIFSVWILKMYELRLEAQETKQEREILK